MKKTAIFLSVSLLAIQANAQEYYHDGVSVCSGGITYTVTLDPFVFTLNNASNQLIHGTWTYKDGRKIESDEDNDYLNAEVKIDPETLKKAFKETFTKAEYQKLTQVREPKFEIYLVISDDVIEELEFMMDIYEAPIFLQIPPAKYALLEKNIKKYVKIEANEYAKKFKYMHATKFVDFSKIQIDYDAETPGPYTKPASQKGP